MGDNKNNQSMRSFFIAGAAILPSYCVALWCSENMHSIPDILFMALLLCLLNFILHNSLCAPGKISRFALPFWWAVCVVPLFIASYSIIRPSFFGRDFTFIVLGMFTLLPVFALSVLISLISFWRAGRAKGGDGAAE